MLPILVLATSICAHFANAGYTYFYSGFPAPLQLNYYQAPTIQQPHYQSVPQQQFAAPPTLTFSPFATFGYQQVPAVQYYNPTSETFQPSQFGVEKLNTSDSSAPPTPSPSYDVEPVDNSDVANDPVDDDTIVTNAFRSEPLRSAADNSIDNFRGFAYRNHFDHARSHVVFITGPEALQYRQSSTLSAPAPISSRTAASDAIDTVETRAERSENHSLDALISYLRNPRVGEQRFYSVNNALVTRRIEDEIPALYQNPKQQTSPLLGLFKSTFEHDFDATSKTESQSVAPTQDKENATSSNRLQSDVTTHEVTADEEETEIKITESNGNMSSATESQTESSTSDTQSTTVGSSNTTEVNADGKVSDKNELSTMETIVVE